MKYKRDHTINNHLHEQGTAFTGDTNLGRFLYHRGVLESDGAPDDDEITGETASASTSGAASDFATSWNPPAEGDKHYGK